MDPAYSDMPAASIGRSPRSDAGHPVSDQADISGQPLDHPTNPASMEAGLRQYVTKNARLVIRHTRTGLAMVYEAHTGDSYTLHQDKKTVHKTEAKEAHKPIESIRNATKDIHVANGWLPYEFKNNGLMVLKHVVGLTF